MDHALFGFQTVCFLFSVYCAELKDIVIGIIWHVFFQKIV